MDNKAEGRSMGECISYLIRYFVAGPVPHLHFLDGERLLLMDFQDQIATSSRQENYNCPMSAVVFRHRKHMIFERGPADQSEKADDTSCLISLWESDE